MENKRLTKKTDFIKIDDFRNTTFLTLQDLINAYNKLIKLEDLEEQLGCPLEVVFKALKDGIYVEEGKFPYTTFEKYEVRGIGLKGLSVISKVCSYAECDFTCEYKDYKKTWWLKKDKSE